MGAFVVGTGVRGAAVPTGAAVGAAVVGAAVVGAGVIGAPVPPGSNVGAAVATHAPLTAHFPLLQTHLLDSHTALRDHEQPQEPGVQVPPVSVLHASLRYVACVGSGDFE